MLEIEYYYNEVCYLFIYDVEYINYDCVYKLIEAYQFSGCDDGVNSKSKICIKSNECIREIFNEAMMDESIKQDFSRHLSSENGI